MERQIKHAKGKGMKIDSMRKKKKLRIPRAASVKIIGLSIKIPIWNFTQDYPPLIKFEVLVYCSTAEGRVDSYLFSANA